MSDELTTEELVASAKACGKTVTTMNSVVQVVTLFRGHLENYSDWNPVEDNEQSELCVKRLIKLEADIAELRDALGAAKCPNCDGSGAIIHLNGVHSDLEQCQWCFERDALLGEQ